MTGARLIAMKVLEIEAAPATAVLHLTDFGRAIHLDGYAWLYRRAADAAWVLIDTGHDHADNLNGSRPPERRWKPLPVAEQLARHGVRTHDIADVILTHLHHDHVGNIEQFPRARWHVPAREWELVHGPERDLLTPSPLYPRPILDRMRDRGVSPFDDGDQPVLGLRLRHTGGHSPGCAAVEVLGDADDLRVVLAGDVMPLFENLSRQIPPGTLWHWGEAVRALRQLGQLPVPVLPSHDPLLMQRYPQGRVIYE